MASEHLGPVFEIHGGGRDLVFPHHENELAQSRALGHEFARIWMHNGMLQMVGEKMSKSLGNIVTLHEALERWGPETILLFFMTAHWRSPIDLSDEVLEQARAQTQTFRDAFVAGGDGGDADWEELVAVLEDDFNTPDALAVFHRWRAAEALGSLRRGLDFFGLGSLAERAEAPAEVSSLAQARAKARATGDFAEADRLRGEIDAAGWEVRDVAGGFELVRRP
jgi:cysteinyl-tRNA synthetase